MIYVCVYVYMFIDDWWRSNLYSVYLFVRVDRMTTWMWLWCLLGCVISIGDDDDVDDGWRLRWRYALLQCVWHDLYMEHCLLNLLGVNPKKNPFFPVGGRRQLCPIIHPPSALASSSIAHHHEQRTRHQEQVWRMRPLWVASGRSETLPVFLFPR